MTKNLYQQDITYCFFEKIGGSGIVRKKFEAAMQSALSAKNGLKTYQNGRVLPLLKRVIENEDIASLEDIAKK